MSSPPIPGPSSSEISSQGVFDATREKQRERCGSFRLMFAPEALGMHEKVAFACFKREVRRLTSGATRRRKAADSFAKGNS